MTDKEGLFDSNEPMELDTYIGLARQFERPTTEQVGSFIDEVRGAHSWYKHLPLVGPGKRFTFFVDLDPGKGWFLTGDNEVMRAPIGNEIRQTTERHLSLFGCLGFECETGTMVIMRDTGSDHACIRGPINKSLQFHNGSLNALPREIADVGSCYLNSTIYKTDYGAIADHLHIAFSLGGPKTWPEEFGGSAALAKLLEEYDTDHDGHDLNLDTDGGKVIALMKEKRTKLTAIMQPEIDRQVETMETTIIAMLDVVFG